MKSTSSWSSVALAFVVSLLILGPISSLIMASAFHTIWGWFIARDLGSGPSLAAWYGISTILSTIIGTAVANLAEKQSEERSVWARVFTRVVGLWLGIAMGLGAMFVTGKILGWL